MRLIDPDIFDKDPDGISIGVLHIKIPPFAYTFNYNDEDYPLEYRQSLLLKEIEDDIAWITSRHQDKKEIYAEHGFDDSKFNRLIELMKKKKIMYPKDSQPITALNGRADLISSSQG